MKPGGRETSITNDMNSHSADEWRKRLEPFDVWNQRAILAVFALLGRPPSMLDIGSGTGAVVKIARMLGIEAVGVDLIAEPPDLKENLATPLNLGRKFALVTSWEVAEHIPEINAGIFANNIQYHVRPGGYLVFTAAGPGQEGEGHLNPKPAFYWRTMFHNHGLSYREDLTYRLKLMWEIVPMPMQWLSANVQIFDKGHLEEKDV